MYFKLFLCQIALESRLLPTSLIECSEKAISLPNLTESHFLFNVFFSLLVLINDGSLLKYQSDTLSGINQSIFWHYQSSHCTKIVCLMKKKLNRRRNDYVIKAICLKSYNPNWSHLKSRKCQGLSAAVGIRSIRVCSYAPFE